MKALGSASILILILVFSFSAPVYAGPLEENLMDAVRSGDAKKVEELLGKRRECEC